jgi:hypothetical protein
VDHPWYGNPIQVVLSATSTNRKTVIQTTAMLVGILYHLTEGGRNSKHEVKAGRRANVARHHFPKIFFSVGQRWNNPFTLDYIKANVEEELIGFRISEASNTVTRLVNLLSAPALKLTTEEEEKVFQVVCKGTHCFTGGGNDGDSKFY